MITLDVLHLHLKQKKKKKLCKVFSCPWNIRLITGTVSFPLTQRDSKCWFLLLGVVTKSFRSPQQALQQRLLLMMRKCHQWQICPKKSGLKFAGGKGWAKGEDPAGCCVPATPAEASTNWRCSRTRNTFSFQSQIFFLVVSSHEFYVWPSNTSFKLIDIRYIHPTPAVNCGRRRAESCLAVTSEGLDAFQGDPC